LTYGLAKPFQPDLGVIRVSGNWKPGVINDSIWWWHGRPFFCEQTA